MFKFKLPFILVALAVALPARAEEKWENISFENGITVQKQEIEGSSHVIFRGMGVINQPVIKILAVLSDYSKHHEWVGNSLGSKGVATINKNERIFYTATKAPWPLKDRDTVARSRFILNKKNKTITILSKETTHPSVPVRSDRVRMPFIRIKWFFKPLKEYKGERTWVIFQVHADPGGVIPAWVANMVSKKIPYDSLNNLRKRLKTHEVNPKFLQEYKAFQNWY